MLPIKFQDNRSFVSGEEAKIDFPDGGHLGFPVGTILAMFYQQVTLFHVNWPFVSGEEAKKKIFKTVAMVAILDFGLELF